MPTPLTMPLSLARSAGPDSRFFLDDPSSMSLTRGGAIRVERNGSPRWKALYSWENLTFAQKGLIEGWYFGMMRDNARFFGSVPGYHSPLFYPNAHLNDFSGFTRAGGGAFNGTATVTAISANSISLGTLPANFVFLAGDMVSLVNGDARLLLKVVADAQANGSGAVTLSISPSIPAAWTTATANVLRPTCRMQPMPNSLKTSNGSPTWSVSFESTEAYL